MANIPSVKIKMKENMTQLYLNGQPIHEDKIDGMGVLKDGHLVLLEIYKKERMVWKGYKVKNSSFKEMYADTMRRKEYV